MLEAVLVVVLTLLGDETLGPVETLYNALMKIFLLFCLILVPCYAKKKPKEPPAPPTPTQADMPVAGTRGCMVIRNITFVPPHGYFHTTGVSGIITNNCGHDGTVSLGADFFDRYNNAVAYGTADKLARVGDTSFEVQPMETDAVIVAGRLRTASGF